MNNIYLIRTGFTPANNAYYNNQRGLSEIATDSYMPLEIHYGRKQAEELGKYLNTIMGKTLILVSSYNRTLETLEIALRNMHGDYKVEVRDELHEINLGVHFARTKEEILELYPVSKAFEEYLQKENIEKLEVEDFENIAGLGIVGKVDNKKLIIGNAKILKEYNIENKYENDEKEFANDGNSIVYVADEKNILALIGVNDIIRENVIDIISKLKKEKIETIMLTGDNENTAQKIAKEIGISKVISNVLPAQKTEVIKKLRTENNFVIMCGDGINDSPALASADIGISVNSGTDIAMDSSDVILTKNNLNGILNLINISKRTVRNIKQNLFWAFFYNVLMIPIAMGVFSGFGITITPMIASIAMMFSSITVILNALRLKNIKLK